MTELELQIIQAQDHAKQLKRRQILLNNQEEKKKRKIINRRKFIIGGLLLKYFPSLVRFRPKSKVKDTVTEFLPIERFIAVLSEDEELVQRLWETANQNYNSE
jgi:hypothetical protein